MDPERRRRLGRAKQRLDRLDLYPRPVSLRGVRVLVVPWLFGLPWFSRFDGYALHWTILLRSEDAGEDLLVHELCHVWQMQHHPVRMPLSYQLVGYERNQYEAAARNAVELTR